MAVYFIFLTGGHNSATYCICSIGFPVMIMAFYRKRSFCSPVMISSLLIALQNGPRERWTPG